MAGKRTVNVLGQHARDGVAADCHGCAVALALKAATGLGGVKVFTDSDRRICLEVNSRSVVAPERVAEFVRTFDGLPRQADGRVVVSAIPRDVVPFAFDLPADDDPAWGVSCERCDRPNSLHDLTDNVCPACRLSGPDD